MTCLIATPEEPERDVDPFVRFRLDTAVLLREATGWESVARFLILTEPDRG